MRHCSLCDAPAKTKDLCTKHYHRLRRHGDPNAFAPNGVRAREVRHAAYPALTDVQQSIIDGSLLGDGYISKNGTSNAKNSSFVKKQKRTFRDKLEWLYDKLLPYSVNIHDNTDKRPGHSNGTITRGTNDAVRLPISIMYTSQHAIFNQYRKRWYTPEGIKTVPRDLLLTPLTVAVWYMDDGSNSPGFNHAFLSTNGFTREECVFLCDKLQLLGIGCNIKPDGQGKPVIRIDSRWYGNFIDMVRPYFLFPSMQYKVSMDPREYASLRGKSHIQGIRGKRFFAY